VLVTAVLLDGGATAEFAAADPVAEVTGVVELAAVPVAAVGSGDAAALLDVEPV
jgi:hypothetical protein